jgi:pimeloyl-ACP methyl ester carboxylesterase
MSAWMIVALGLALPCLAGLIAEPVARRRGARRHPPPGRLIEIARGRSLHLLCEGSAGPVIVVEQGAGEPAILWRELQVRASAFGRVCLYDRAGYGWSPPAPSFQDVAARAQDLRALLRAAGLEPPYLLVAHSYGGLVVRAFAARFPADVGGMLMVDAVEESIAFHPDYLKFLRLSKPFVGLLRAAARLGLLGLMSRLGAKAEDTPAQKAAAAQAVCPSHFRAVAGDLRSIDEASRDYPLPKGMGPLGDIPVIAVTHGKPFPGPFRRLEPFWLEGQRRWTRLTSRGELVVAERSNHMIVFEEPDLVLDALRRLAAGIDKPPPPPISAP